MEFFSVILLIIGCIVLICLTPFLSFIEGWIVGWLVKVVFGTTFVAGLKLLNINIDINSIPLLCGVLCVIGSFFRTINFNKDKFIKN